MPNLAKDYFKGLFHLFFPHVCASCSNVMAKDEEVLCLVCEHSLPETKFHTFSENPIEKRFWGRVSIENASSFLFFEKGSRTQHLMQLLKYQGRQDVGQKLGALYAQKLKNDLSPLVKVDAVIPTPLHPKKKHKRGYNQCDSIADAIAKAWKIEVYKNAVIRKQDNITQTGKSRIDRWDNVAEIFSVQEAELLENKHLLVIDDVITTGSTLEAVTSQILKVPNTKVSILTLACAV